MDEEEIKRKLDEMRKNRIVLTDDRPVRANIARGIIEPAAKTGQPGTQLATKAQEKPAASGEPDVAAIMEERSLKTKAFAARTIEPRAPQEQGRAEPAAPKPDANKPQAEPAPAPKEPKPEVQASVNIARGIVGEQKPDKKKLAPLPRPPRPPYGRERKSFFDEVLDKEQKPPVQAKKQEAEVFAHEPGPEKPAPIVQKEEPQPEKQQEPVTLSPESEKIEEEQFAQDLVKEEASAKTLEESRGHAHRQYLHTTEPAALSPEKAEEEEMAKDLMPQVKKVTAFAPPSAAKRDETPETLAAAHSQLSDQSQQLSRREKRRLEEDEKKAPTAEGAAKANEPKPELTLEDIIGPAGGTEEKPSSLFGGLEAATAAAGESAAGSSSLFGELESVAGGTAVKKPGVVNVEVKKEQPLSCPTCKAQNTRVVFCPYCGTGMCANCSPNIRTEGDLFIFTCPKCSEEVNVAKKAQQG
jgi:hypothetical protein